MEARQRKSRFRMVEIDHRLPDCLRVAAGALSTELAAVFVVVAGRATCLQFEITPGLVTLIAGERGVTSFEDISRLRMVECGHTGRPPDETEFAARMLRVTARAVALTFARINDARVISTVAGHPLLYVHVTRIALQLRTSCPENVAIPALQNALKTLMGSG
jgi:hypothetical protein